MPPRVATVTTQRELDHLAWRKLRPPDPQPSKRTKRKATGHMRQRVYERDDFRCVECGTIENLTLDHHLPRSKGGKSTFENLRTMCSPCNSRKADSILA